MRIPDSIFVQTTQLDAALLFLDNESDARFVKSLCINERSRGALDPPPPNVDDAVFVELVSKCPNLQSLIMRSWLFYSLRPHLLSRCSFSRLSSLAIGWNSTLTVAGFFGLLSVMPALKKLVLGRVELPDGRSSDSTAAVDEEDLATPACSLTHLGVSDDWDIDFEHYPLLLSRSHNTLEHLELHWIYREDIADAVVRALERCTRVRHLSLIGNGFPTARIIAACPGVCSLTLNEVPNDLEWASLRAPFRALKLVDCYSTEPDEYLAEAWELLKNRVLQTPMLSEIGFNFMGKTLPHETDSYREMRRVCAERRIRLSLWCTHDALWI